MTGGQSGSNLVPEPPRAVPKWFFVRRMQAMLFAGVLMVVVGAASTIGVSAGFIATDGWVFPLADYQLDRRHATATGVILDKDYITSVHMDSRHPWRIHFEFVTPEANMVRATGFTYDSSFAEKKPGDLIDVEYDPQRPSLARPAGGGVTSVPPWVYLLAVGPTAVAVPVGIALLLIAWTRTRRERLLLACGQGADAEVVRVRQVWGINFGRKHPYDVYYRFSDRYGREALGKDRTYHYAWAKALTPGQKVGVVYHPDWPAANVLWLHGRDVASQS